MSIKRKHGERGHPRKSWRFIFLADEQRAHLSLTNLSARSRGSNAQVTLRFRYFDEFANRSTFEGYSLQIAGAVSF
jgi:hypothetical protein